MYRPDFWTRLCILWAEAHEKRSTSEPYYRKRLAEALEEERRQSQPEEKSNP